MVVVVVVVVVVEQIMRCINKTYTQMKYKL